MTKRLAFYCVLVCGLLVVLWMSTPLSAQDDPDQLTIQAGVDGLFTATAQAEAYSTFALTVESAFRQTQTATNAPTEATPTETPLDLNAMTMTDAARLLTAQVTTPTAVAALE